jgi:hypothetical protein
MQNVPRGASGLGFWQAVQCSLRLEMVPSASPLASPSKDLSLALVSLSVHPPWPEYGSSRGVASFLKPETRCPMPATQTVLHKLKAWTSCAPERTRIVAQALMVAPVVKTSSIRSTLPRTGPLAL